jgi:two-component system CAI-1 autoinducer sensor kinase/phosphatase CqsS
MNILKSINQVLKFNFSVARYNVPLAGLLSFVGHPTYWILWTYIFPNHYDSSILRFSSSLLGLILIFHNYWPKSFKKYRHIYWYCCAIYVLTMTFTYLGLKNSFTDIWIICIIMVLFFLLLSFPII